VQAERSRIVWFGVASRGSAFAPSSLEALVPRRYLERYAYGGNL
jgi:hypothetical protein